MPPWVVVGPGDDAAVIEPERGALEVLTTDAQVEGIHFDRRFVPPDAIGYRALAVNLSDIAAMGARPRAALLSLVMPDATEAADVDGLLDGMLALAAAHRVALIGGNITRTTGPLTIDVTATGTVHPRRILRRSGARPGDEVYVTGTLGDAAAGLRELQGRADLVRSPPASLTRLAPEGGADPQVGPTQTTARYLRPEPRVRAGMLLGRHRAATSCMDLSDGLADAVRQVATASGVGMVIDVGALPLSEASRAWHAASGGDPITTALTGGDDYELLFTVRPSHRGRLRGVQQVLGGLPITRIGVVTKDTALRLYSPEGTRDLPAGYEHFADRLSAGYPLRE